MPDDQRELSNHSLANNEHEISIMPIISRKRNGAEKSSRKRTRRREEGSAIRRCCCAESSSRQTNLLSAVDRISIPAQLEARVEWKLNEISSNERTNQSMDCSLNAQSRKTIEESKVKRLPTNCLRRRNDGRQSTPTKRPSLLLLGCSINSTLCCSLLLLIINCCYLVCSAQTGQTGTRLEVASKPQTSGGGEGGHFKLAAAADELLSSSEKSISGITEWPQKATLEQATQMTAASEHKHIAANDSQRLAQIRFEQQEEEETNRVPQEERQEERAGLDELTFVRLFKRSIVSSSSSSQTTIGIGNEQQTQSKQPSEPTTRLVALSGHSIELQCPLASELLAVANSGAAQPDHTIVWRKDGIQLNQLTNRRIQLNPSNGSLLIQRAQARLDEGSFECQLVHVSKEDLPIKSHRFQLKLLLAPRLNPFEFPSDAQIGMKMLLTCSALEGQQPISFVWLKDNQIIQDLSGSSAASRPQTQQANDNPQQFSNSSLAAAARSKSKMLSSSLEQLHQQQLADKLALSSGGGATASLSIVQKPEYVLIGGGRSGLADEDALGESKLSGAESTAAISTSLTTILEDPTIRIRQSDDYSILSIEQLELKHSGRYTCTAQNEAARASHSSQLIINAPPTFKLEPKDTDLVSGQSTVIECAAVGQPRPSISWLRARESSSKQWDFVQIYDNLRYSLLANGSLAISNATQREQGLYMCAAKNGFGPELTKLIRITIHEPARISMKYKTTETRIDERALMSCSVSGEQPLSLSWLDKQGKLIDKNDKRFIIDDGADSSAVVPQEQQQTVGSDSAAGAPNTLNSNQTSSESRLIIARASRQDSGHYTCQASNRFGTDKMVINLLVLDVPDKIAQLKVTNLTSQTVSLRWQLGFNGNSPVTSYLVQYQSDDPLDDLLMSLNSDNQMTTSAQRLLDGGGLSHQDQSISSLFFGSTAPETAHAVPNSSGQQQQQQQQTSPSLSSLKAALETLNKIASESTKMSSADEAIDRTLVELTIEQTATNVLIKDLNPFCVYRIRLAGINKIGLGEFSDWLRVKTDEAPPSGTALKISASATGPNSIKLTWFPPDRRQWNGQLTRFNIGYRPLDSAFEFNKSIEWSPPSLQSIILDNVADKTTTMNKKQLHNQIERSLNQTQADATNTNSSTSPVDPAAKPSSAKTGSTTENNSSFMLRQHLRQLLAMQQHELLAHLTNLQRSTTYLVWIQAVNGRGSGPQSHAITVKTLDDVPPSAPALRIQSTTTNSITLTWSLLSNFVSSANQYSLFYRRVPPPTTTALNQAPPPLSLSARQQQQYHGSNGSSIDPPVPLLPPQMMMLSTEPGPFIERTITSQQLMASSGLGENIQQQQADFQMGLQQQQQQQQQHYQQFVYTLDQLDCGSVYELYMTTRNSVGKSEPSSVITTRTLGEPPLAPANKNSLFARIGAQDVQLNLASWSTGGCPVTHITVRYKQTPAPVAASSTSSGGASSSDDNLHQPRNSSTPIQPAATPTVGGGGGWPISASVPQNLLTNINSQLLEFGSQAQQRIQQFHPFALTNPANLIEHQQQHYSHHSSAAPFLLKNLQPNTGYELEIIAHNVAGHTTGQYEFVTAGLNGSRSGYTRREGVYRIDQRGQQLHDVSNGGEQQQALDPLNQSSHHQQQQQSISNQLFPLALTVLCFVCVIISSTFCYYRLAETWKRTVQRGGTRRRRSSDGGDDNNPHGGGACRANLGPAASPSSTILSQMAKSAGFNWSPSTLQPRGVNGTTMGQQQQQQHRQPLRSLLNQHQRHEHELDDGQSTVDSSPPPPLSAAHYCLRDHHHQHHHQLQNNQQQQQQQFCNATLNPKFSQSVSMKDFNNLIGANGLHAQTLNLKACRQVVAPPATGTTTAANHRSSLGGGGLMLMKGLSNLGATTRTMGRNGVELVNDDDYGNPKSGNNNRNSMIYDNHQDCQQQVNNNYGPAAYGGGAVVVSDPDHRQQHETSYMTTNTTGTTTNYAIPSTGFYQQQHNYDPPNMNHYQSEFNPSSVNTAAADQQQLQSASIDECIEHLIQNKLDQNGLQQQQQQQYAMIVSQQQQQQLASNTNNNFGAANYANSNLGANDNLDSWHQINLNSNQNNLQQQPVHCSGQSVIESSSSSSGIGTSTVANLNLDCGASMISSNATTANSSTNSNNNHPFHQLNQT